MKKIFYIIVLSLTLSQCQKNDAYQIDDQHLEINDFVWKGMNALYLWKNQVPDL